LFEGQLADVLHRLLVELHRLFEIDDVDLVALAEDVLGHFRIPVSRLVAEVHSGFQHLTHRYRHCHAPSGLDHDPPMARTRRRLSTTGGSGTLRCGSANLPVCGRRPLKIQGKRQ
jgi:hypothetical protein